MMIMTSTPDHVPARPGGAPGIPDAAGSGTNGEADVLCLGRHRPQAPTWLLVTEIDGPAGEVFTARPVPGPRPHAHGGDVLVRVAPEADAAVSVTVWTVAAGALVPVAGWDLPDDGSWPERVRPTVMFTMSAMTGLGEHADLGELDPVDLDAAAATAVPGLPGSLGPHQVTVIG
jgi:hypothetical protein